MTDEPERAIHEHVVRGVGSSTRHNALAYGYSLALTGTFGVLTTLDHTPHVGDVFLFGVGGSVTFAIANTLATRGFTVRADSEPPIVRALASSLGFISVSGALGIAALLGWALAGWVAWLVAPFAASGVYLVLSAFEFVVARALRRILGRDRLEERE